ncbi:MAG: LytTR family DNA-binding domain-containing protein [Bacteroidetes bacterium]|nr:LytTR family DNA-binding domain-containing protein [Bacteroidota bacterium]
MLNVIIVDDEINGREVLTAMLNEYCKGVEVIGTAASVAEATNLIKEKKPDAVFLDIEMPGGNGFDLLDSFEKIDFDIIFVTAYQQYAIKAIKFSALDYLLKPVLIDDLIVAVEKLKAKNPETAERDRYANLRNGIALGNPFNKIILNTFEGFHFVKSEDIIYCKAEDNYTQFTTTTDTLLISKPLKEYDELFEGMNFYRIHKSFLINLNHIKSVTRIESCNVIMDNGDELPVSQRRKDEFLQAIKKM